MLDISVPKISLQRPGVVAFVRQSVTAGVPQHVGMRLEAESGLRPRTFHHAGKAGRRERRAALGREHKG